MVPKGESSFFGTSDSAYSFYKMWVWEEINKRGSKQTRFLWNLH